MRQRKGLLVLALVLLVVAVAAVGCRPRSTPTPVPQSEGAGHASEEQLPADPVLRGQMVFNTVGCVACHGENGQGTEIAPALPGHTETQLRRQVRAPVGIMPVFSPEKLPEDQLDALVAYITSMQGSHAHQRAGGDVAGEVQMHHWIALSAIEDGAVDEAIHHVGHIIELTEADHQARMQGVLSDLEAGRPHDAAHVIEEMLAGVLEDGLTAASMQLKMALSSARVGNAEAAAHHVEHFDEAASGADHEAGEAVLSAIQAGDLEEAEHEIVAMLSAAGVSVEAEGHGHAEAEEEGHAHAEGEEGEHAHAEGEDVSPELAPLVEALEAIRGGDLETATHDLEQFIENASGINRIKTEEALHLLEAGELHYAQDTIGEMLGLSHDH